MSNENYCGRFAPSPTGRLHFGSLVAAVASYAQAKAKGGVWIVRMEDLDRPRERPGMADALIADLAAFGLRSDETVVKQSQRDDRYARALDQLDRQGLIYGCACTRAKLGGAPVYPGYCRDGLPRGETARALRIRVPTSTVSFHDRVQGPIAQSLAADVGDFIVRRADGLFAYQLAVVVDDADQGITEVVRGCDLLDSTPRQIFLQRQLGLSTPGYLHVPLAVDETGAKLSKSWDAAPVDPEAPLNGLLQAWQFLGQLSLHGSSSSPRTVDEFWRLAIDCWDSRRIPAEPTVRPSSAVS